MICVPHRYRIIIAASLGMLIVHAMRVNIAVTVVTILDDFPSEIVDSNGNVELPPVVWTSRMVGFLHSIFYVGFLISQLPVGYLVTKLPAHIIYGSCIFTSCALNLLLPVSIQYAGFEATCCIRCLQGLAEGSIYPCCYAIMRYWATPEERSMVGSVVLSGVYSGPVIGLILSGAIAHFYSWQWVYYVHSIGGLLWVLLWKMVAYETPDKHPSIPHEEREFIKLRQGESAIIYKDEHIPWIEILTSMPVNALNVCNFARSFVFFLLLTNEPAYLNVFEYTLVENGILSALPHALLTVVVVLGGPLADHLIVSVTISRTIVRKLFTGLGFGIEAICLFILYFTRTGQMSMIFLTLGVATSGISVSGWQINHLDLAPRYASVLVALTTAIGTIAGIVNPLIVGELTRHQTIEEWQNVFLVTSAILAFAAFFYLVFGSGEQQVWAESRTYKENINKSVDEDKIQPYGTFTTSFIKESKQEEDIKRLAEMSHEP